MRRRGSRGETPPETGPFRKMEQVDERENLPYNEAVAIKRMVEKIEAEKKFSIRLPEDIKQDDLVPLFEDAINNNIDPKDIAFYSLATGILNFTHIQEPNLPKIKYFYYNNPEDKNVELEIFMNLSTQEGLRATVQNLSTKAKAENDRKLNRENQKQSFNHLMLRCEEDIQDVTEVIEKHLPTDLLSEEMKEAYINKLKTVKANAEHLVSSIDKKLKEVEKKK